MILVSLLRGDEPPMSNSYAEHDYLINVFGLSAKEAQQALKGA